MDHFSTLAAGCRLICGTDDYLGRGLVGPTIPPEYRDSATHKPIILEKFVNVGTNVVIAPGWTRRRNVVGAIR